MLSGASATLSPAVAAATPSCGALGVVPSSSASSLGVSGDSYSSSLLLDLRDQAYNDLHVLAAKFAAKAGERGGANSGAAAAQHGHAHSSAYPWSILILSGNMLSRLDGLSRCGSRLRKLDLSRNGIDVLPKSPSFWRSFSSLQVLLLHQNKLDSIHALQQLSILPALEILTCFGNAVEHHPAYRHVMVNVCGRLKLLDFYIVSDAELIEGADWAKRGASGGQGNGNKFAAFSREMECDILSIGGGGGAGIGGAGGSASTSGANASVLFDSSESAHLQLLSAQLEIVRKQHRRFSPVLKIQSLFRGILVRRTIRVYNEAATSIQHAWRKVRARKMMERSAASGTAGTAVATLDSKAASAGPLHPLSSLAAHTIFLVHTSDVAVSLFLQLVKRVEQSEGILASDDLEPASMLLLSAPNIKDDYPLVRRIFPHRDVKAGNKLLPGLHATPAARHALSVLKARPSGCVLNEHARFLLRTRLSQSTYKSRMLAFHSPGRRFHELLIRAIHSYNIDQGHYNDPVQAADGAADGDANQSSAPLQPPPSLDPATEDLTARADFQARLQMGDEAAADASRRALTENRVIIYPATTLNVIASAVAIQATWRSYRVRRDLAPTLAARIVQRRALTAIVRWWRACLFRIRMHLLKGLKAYGDSINSRHLFARGDIVELVRENAPNPFVDAEFNPEHRSIFGIEPKDELATGAFRGGAGPGAAGGSTELIGKLTLVVDQNTPKRFYPFPRCLAAHWNHAPLPCVHGLTDSGIRADLASRLTELIQEGVQLSVLPDVSAPASERARSGGAAAAASPEAGQWSASSFLKLSFASVEEARTRALVLAINTWLPRFHLLRPRYLRALGPFTSATPATALAGSEVAFLMTPQHMSLCLQYQQAGGPCGAAGERHILYTTFWTPLARTAPPALYSNQAYLDLQYQLKMVEETHLAAEKLEQRNAAAVVLPVSLPEPKKRPIATDASMRSFARSSGFTFTSRMLPEAADLEVQGDDAVSTYQPSVFALKRELAESERLMSRRSVAAARIKIHTDKMSAQESARSQTVMHRIKMEALAEREIDARRQRQLDYDRLDAVARAARDRILAAKHAMVHNFKHDLAARSKLREMDREADSKELRRRVALDKQALARELLDRNALDASKVASKVALKSSDALRHRRLAEEKESTLAFVSAQNMIARQLTSGMRSKLRSHSEQKTQATVAARREIAVARRQAVHSILFENFTRRRQGALASSLEISSHLQTRALADAGKLELMRLRRAHAAAVKSLANQAGIASLDATTLPTQQELQQALVQASAHFTPFAATIAQQPTSAGSGPMGLQQQQYTELRPSSSGSGSSRANPLVAAAYLPSSSLRQATSSSVGGGSMFPALGRSPMQQAQASAAVASAPPAASYLNPLLSDQLSLQLRVLRDLADKVKLQYQTSTAGAQAGGGSMQHQPQPPSYPQR